MLDVSAARQVGSRSHSILAALAGGMFEACHETSGQDIALAIAKVAGAAFATGLFYALGAAFASWIVARSGHRR